MARVETDDPRFFVPDPVISLAEGLRDGLNNTDNRDRALNILRTTRVWSNEMFELNLALNDAWRHAKPSVSIEDKPIIKEEDFKVCDFNLGDDVPSVVDIIP